jgi:hypothetical protein
LVLDEVGEGAGDQHAEDGDADHELLGLGLVTVHQVEEAQPEGGGDAREDGREDGAEVKGVVEARDQLDEPEDQDEADEAGDEEELGTD